MKRAKQTLVASALVASLVEGCSNSECWVDTTYTAMDIGGLDYTELFYREDVTAVANKEIYWAYSYDDNNNFDIKIMADMKETNSQTALPLDLATLESTDGITLGRDRFVNDIHLTGPINHNWLFYNKHICSDQAYFDEDYVKGYAYVVTGDWTRWSFQQAFVAPYPFNNNNGEFWANSIYPDYKADGNVLAVGCPGCDYRIEDGTYQELNYGKTYGGVYIYENMPSDHDALNQWDLYDVLRKDQSVQHTTSSPTQTLTVWPSISHTPTNVPTDSPSFVPTEAPTITSVPTDSPSFVPTELPSFVPTAAPITTGSSPSQASPTTSDPTGAPTITSVPTDSPSFVPTDSPITSAPTGAPTITSVPTEAPTLNRDPTSYPSGQDLDYYFLGATVRLDHDVLLASVHYVDSDTVVIFKRKPKPKTAKTPAGWKEVQTITSWLEYDVESFAVHDDTVVLGVPDMDMVVTYSYSSDIHMWTIQQRLWQRNEFGGYSDNGFGADVAVNEHVLVGSFYHNDDDVVAVVYTRCDKYGRWSNEEFIQAVSDYDSASNMASRIYLKGHDIVVFQDIDNNVTRRSLNIVEETETESKKRELFYWANDDEDESPKCVYSMNSDDSDIDYLPIKYSNDEDWDCLNIELFDTFGDGWSDVELVITDPMGNKESFAPRCDSPNEIGIRYCPKFSCWEGTYTVEIPKGKDSDFAWEMFYYIYIDDSNPSWSSSSQYVGKDISKFSFEWDEETLAFTLIEAKNDLAVKPTPCYSTTDTCKLRPDPKPKAKPKSKPKASPTHAPAARRLAQFDDDDALWQYFQMESVSSSGWSSSYKGTHYYISDPHGKHLISTNTLCTGYSDMCWEQLKDGNYTLRVTGELNNDDIDWSFCGVSGGPQEEVFFGVHHGECKVYEMNDADDVCENAGTSYWDTGSFFASGDADLLVMDLETETVISSTSNGYMSFGTYSSVGFVGCLVILLAINVIKRRRDVVSQSSAVPMYEAVSEQSIHYVEGESENVLKNAMS